MTVGGAATVDVEVEGVAVDDVVEFVNVLDVFKVEVDEVESSEPDEETDGPEGSKLCNRWMIWSKLGRLSGSSAQQSTINLTQAAGALLGVGGRIFCVPTAKTTWNGGIPRYGSSLVAISHKTMPKL